MTTVEINGKEFTVGKDGRLYERVSTGPEEWGTSAMMPAAPHHFAGLEEVSTDLDLGEFPKIPFEKMMFVRNFFSAVYAEHKSEAFVYFHLDRETKEYTIIVPMSQKASAGHVSFDGYVAAYCEDCQVGTPDREATECAACGSTNMKESFIVGTCHSHGSMAAFHSATDDENELTTSGFHITLGKVDQQIFEIAHSFVIAKPGHLDDKGRGTRYKETLPIEDLIENPFVGRSHLIQRWVSLVISKPALARLDKDHEVLLVGTGDEKNPTIEVFSTLGCKETYGRMASALQSQPGVVATETCSVSTLRDMLKKQEEAKKKRSVVVTSSSRPGLKPSPVSGPAGSVVYSGNPQRVPTSGTTIGGTPTPTIPVNKVSTESRDTGLLTEMMTKEASVLKLHGDQKKVLSVDGNGVLSQAKEHSAGATVAETFDLAYMLNNCPSDVARSRFARYVIFDMCTRADDLARTYTGSEGVSLALSTVATAFLDAVMDTVPELTPWEEQNVLDMKNGHGSRLLTMYMNRVSGQDLKDDGDTLDEDDVFFEFGRNVWVIQKFLQSLDRCSVLESDALVQLGVASLDAGQSFMEAYAVREKLRTESVFDFDECEIEEEEIIVTQKT